LTEREIIETTLRRCDGQAIGDPGYTVEQIAAAILAALRESRKVDVEQVRRFFLLDARAMAIVAHAIEVVNWTVTEGAFMDMHRDEECGESLQALFDSLVSQGFITKNGERR
jgi:hypothetical protein